MLAPLSPRREASVGEGEGARNSRRGRDDSVTVRPQVVGGALIVQGATEYRA